MFFVAFFIAYNYVSKVNPRVIDICGFFISVDRREKLIKGWIRSMDIKKYGWDEYFEKEWSKNSGKDMFPGRISADYGQNFA